VLASIVIVMLPLAIVQGLGVVLIVGKSLNVKDIQDVGKPGDTEKKVIKLKEEGKSKDEVKAILLDELKRKKRKLFPCIVDDEYKYDYNTEGKENHYNSTLLHQEQHQDRGLEGGRHIEMAMTMQRPHHQTVAEIILRDSIGPEMPPPSPFGGVGGGHPCHILALPQSSHHVLQAHGHLHILHQQHHHHHHRFNQQHDQRGQGQQPFPAEGPQTGEMRRCQIQRPASSPQGAPTRLRIHSPRVPALIEASPTLMAPQRSLLQSLSRLPDAPQPQSGAVPIRRIKITSPRPRPEDNP
jgi:hypothetical protein